jgi:hypothetical protein
MLSGRQRKTSPHSAAVIFDTQTTGAGMGVKHNYALTGVVLPCRIAPIKTSDAVAEAMSQPVYKQMYRVRFPSQPSLNPLLNRLKIVTPAPYAGKVLRLSTPVMDSILAGWSFQVICEEHSEDQQTAPSLMAAPKAKRRKRRVR